MPFTKSFPLVKPNAIGNNDSTSFNLSTKTNTWRLMPMYPNLDYLNNIIPYPPGKPIKEVERELGIKNAIKLASNENPWGFSDKVKKAIVKNIKDLNIYPDGNSFYLKQKIAQVHGVNIKNILVGNGSNEVLELIMRCFLTGGYSIVTGRYSFILYRLIGQALNAEVIFTQDKDLAYDADAIIRACDEKTAMIIIDNPNNPTGTYIPFNDILRIVDFAEKNKIITVIDEAYFEYARAKDYGSILKVFQDYKNLVVIRTFSKVYGLSGLRAGYAIAHEWILDLANRIRAPFNVNSLAQAGCLAAMEDMAFIKKIAGKNHACIDFFYKEFDKMGLKYLPTQCNFILVEIPISGKEAFEKLLRLGIIVRPVGNYGLEKYIRISIGTMVNNRKAINAIKKVLKNA
jgi:histidinol-phosphate aminotransferase